jgi:lipid-A-disaccharide synthase
MMTKITTIIVTPGSRIGEIKRIYPIMIDTISILQNNYNYYFNIYTFATENTLKTIEKYSFKTKIVVSQEEKQKILSLPNTFAIAKSGTNAFEFNIYNIPLVIVYTMNYLTNKLGKILIKTKYANLVNIVAKKEIIPEFIGDKAKPILISKKIDELLRDDTMINTQLTETKEIIKQLGYNGNLKSSDKISNEIMRLLDY